MPRVRLHLTTVTRRQLWDFGAVELSRGLEMIVRAIAGEDIGAGTGRSGGGKAAGLAAGPTRRARREAMRDVEAAREIAAGKDWVTGEQGR